MKIPSYKFKLFKKFGQTKALELSCVFPRIFTLLFSYLNMKVKNKHISVGLRTVGLMTDDCNQLQKDLNKLVNWASEMQMKFNAFKCYVLRITNKKRHVLHN